MAYRTITGDFAYLPSGVAVVRARLLRGFATATETFLLRSWEATPASSGTFSLSLPVPDTGTARYGFDLPDGRILAVKLASGPTTTLEALINAVAGASTPQNVVQAAIDSEAAARITADLALGVRIDGVTGGSGISNHGALSGLSNDDHAQYHTNARGDARYSALSHNHDTRYYTETETDTLLAAKAPTNDLRLSDARTPLAHGHTIIDTTGLQAALDSKALATSIAAHEVDTTSVHGIADTSALVVTTDTRLSNARTPLAHVHADATGSASGFLSVSDKTKIDGVASGATANRTDAATDTAMASAINTHNVDTATHGQTSAGRALLTAATAAVQRTALALGSAALSAVADFAAAVHSHAAADIASGTLDAARLPALGNSLPFRARAFSSDPWTAMPAALTELYNTTSGRMAADLTGAREARIVARIATVGLAGSELRLQYSTNNGTSWAYADGASGPALSLTASGTVRGAWATLVAGAKADVDLRLIGINGDGVAAPSFGTVTVQVR